MKMIKRTLNEASGVDPGCVEIMPRNLGTRHVRTWLYSLHTEIKKSSDNLTLVTGDWCTVNVWKSCGLWPTVSGCWTITRTEPDRVPYAISIQFPHKPIANWKSILVFRNWIRRRISYLWSLVSNTPKSLWCDRVWDLCTVRWPINHCLSCEAEISAYLRTNEIQRNAKQMTIFSRHLPM